MTMARGVTSRMDAPMESEGGMGRIVGPAGPGGRIL